MKNKELLIRLIQNTMNLPAFGWDGTDKLLKKVEKEHCFSKQVQPMLTAEGLKAVLKQIKTGYLYDIQDRLGVHFLVFKFQKDIICAGPFVIVEWNEKMEETYLLINGLSAEDRLAYKLYYCRYLLINTEQIIQVITGIISALQPEEESYIYKEIQDKSGIGKSQVNFYEREESDFKEVIERYSFENQFIAMVETGNTEKAIKTISLMYRAPGPKELSVPGMQSLVGNATTLRTILRKAAERGGVHPAIVDAIALSYGQKMYVARSPKELWSNLLPMTRDFTEAVRKAKTSKYSPIIKMIMSYIQLNISRKISLKEMAASIGYTTEHLERKFKEETGMTVVQYIARERCYQAALLLEQTDYEIQEISARVGYLDSNYFVKVFKKYMNFTPTAYRKNFHS